MKNASLLVLVGSSLVPSDLESLSETARDRGLHLSVVVLGATPQIPTYAYGVGDFGSFAIPLRWQEQVDQVNAELNRLSGVRSVVQATAVELQRRAEEAQKWHSRELKTSV